MSPNRKAELQRKLAMAPVPKPPAGLAERIKGDIPHPLKFDVIKERQRLSQSVAFNMRVAASILLLISSLYVVLHLMSRAERSASVAATKVAVAERAPAPQVLQRPQLAPPPPPVAVVEAKKRADEENRPVTTVAAAKPMPPARARREDVPAAPAQPPASAPAESQTADGVAGRVSGGVAESAPTIVANAEAAKARPAVKTEQAPLPTVAPVAPPPRAMDIVASAQAKELELEPNTLFGLPAQRSAAPPRSLRIESSSEIKDGKTLLRIAIDAPDASPAAVDAKIEIDWRVPHDAVNAFSAATELAIPARASIAGVYAVALPPDLSRRSIVAKVTLRYRSVKDGSEHSVTRTIRRRDLAAPDHQ